MPHSIGVPVGEADGPIAKTLSKIVEDWHRSGKLLEVQKKWGIPNTRFHREMHEKYKNTPAT